MIYQKCEHNDGRQSHISNLKLSDYSTLNLCTLIGLNLSRDQQYSIVIFFLKMGLTPASFPFILRL